MGVLIKMNAQGLQQGTYDQMTSQLMDELRRQPGFQFHVASVSSDGMEILEVWDDQESFDSWYQSTIAPSLSDVKVSSEVVQLHNLISY